MYQQAKQEELKIVSFDMYKSLERNRDYLLEAKIPKKYTNIVTDIDYTVQAIQDLLLNSDFPSKKDEKRLNGLCDDLVAFTRTLYVLTQRINKVPNYMQSIYYLQETSNNFKKIIEELITLKYAM